MSLTINEIKRIRLDALRELKRRLRSADTKLEKSQRAVDRFLARKDKMPELRDFMAVAMDLEDLDVYLSSDLYVWLDETVIPALEAM